MRLSIGSWAYAFGPYEKNPVPFDEVVDKLGRLGMEGVELGAFPPHPNLSTHDTRAKRLGLYQMVRGHNLHFSGMAPNLWMHKLPSVPDSGPYIAEFARNVQLADDLNIGCLRVDTLEPPDVFEKTGVDPQLGRERVIRAWKLCCKIADDRGMRVVWEFEPGFAFNKPSEIVGIMDEVRADCPNFASLFDVCHAYMCAVVGARQPGDKEVLPGGVLELLQKLQGRIGHIHVIDSDGTLHNNETSTHRPFGEGLIDFDQVLPALQKCGCPDDWLCIDLCFWPDAWNVTEAAITFLREKLQKLAA